MDKVMVVVWVPVAVSYVEVTCHDYCVVQVDDVLAQEASSRLITVGIDIDNEVHVMVVMEGQDINIPVVDNVET